MGLASYRAMTHTNDAQIVHNSQTRSVCKPRPPAYNRGPACILKARPLLVQYVRPPACIRGRSVEQRTDRDSHML